MNRNQTPHPASFFFDLTRVWLFMKEAKNLTFFAAGWRRCLEVETEIRIQLWPERADRQCRLLIRYHTQHHITEPREDAQRLRGYTPQLQAPFTVEMPASHD